MRVLIVNDEPPVRATVHMLSSLSDFEPVGEAANGMEAVQLMQTQRPAVVLMDIHMPGMVSLEAPHLAQREEPPAIIFTTAYSKYALEAFDTHAVFYLVSRSIRNAWTGAQQSAQTRPGATRHLGATEGGPQDRSHACADTWELGVDFSG
jgi:two-component system, LytTR family, response regulator AlgR